MKKYIVLVLFIFSVSFLYSQEVEETVDTAVNEEALIETESVNIEENVNTVTADENEISDTEEQPADVAESVTSESVNPATFNDQTYFFDNLDIYHLSVGWNGINSCFLMMDCVGEFDSGFSMGLNYLDFDVEYAFSDCFALAADIKFKEVVRYGREFPLWRLGLEVKKYMQGYPKSYRAFKTLPPAGLFFSFRASMYLSAGINQTYHGFSPCLEPAIGLGYRFVFIDRLYVEPSLDIVVTDLLSSIEPYYVTAGVSITVGAIIF